MVGYRKNASERHGGIFGGSCHLSRGFAKGLRIPPRRCFHSASPNNSCWSIPVMYWPGASWRSVTTCNSSQGKARNSPIEQNTMILTMYLQKHQTTCADWSSLNDANGQFFFVHWGLIMLSHAGMPMLPSQNDHPQPMWLEHGSIPYVS